MKTYIARLTDRGALGSPIVWRTPSITEARELLVNVGSWQTAPDKVGEPGDHSILLGSSAQVEIFEDEPPFNVGDDLDLRIEDRMPYRMFSVGPRGGIKERKHF